MCIGPLVVVSGSKLKSNGLADISVIGRFVRSISSFEEWLI